MTRAVPRIADRVVIGGGIGGLVADFVVEWDRGIVHVLNALSPAATAGLAIARMI